MARKEGKVYLGYEDESITEKNLTLVNFAVNKVGGVPSWPPLESIQLSLKCPLCGLYRLLVVQCYAPLENSVYHRILYVFACINPNCWTLSDSWLCIRTQYQDTSATVAASIVAMPSPDTNVAWCTGADDWDENDNNDSANGNIMNIDNAPSPHNAMQRNSDEDEESNSYEIDSVEQALGNMQVFDAHNANNMSPVQGAVGAIHAPIAAAELEGGDEPGLVSVDTPTAPSKAVEELLNQTAELPVDMRRSLMVGPLQFAPKFIYVEEEWKKTTNNDEKAVELFNKYKRENDMEQVEGGVAVGGEDEVYEEAAPLHGDRLFHAFLMRLKVNPGQILRYSREEPPILGAPLPVDTPETPLPPACLRCGSPLICELQLLPEFAQALRAILLAVPLEAISVNPSLCPTNKIAPHKRIANWQYGTGRTFGAFYDLLVPGDSPYPNYPNGLQEQPQEDPSDCGEIEDYDENDLSSITPQGNRRQGHRDSRGFGFSSFFDQPLNRPERLPHRPERPPYRPERPPYRPERPPYQTERPQRPQRPPPTNRPQTPSYPATRPPYWSGGFFGSNEYRPPLHQNPSDTVKPIHEYTEHGDATYRPNIVGGPLGHVVGVSPIIPTRQDTTTARTFYDRYRPSTLNNSYPTRNPRARNLNNNIIGSFVDLLFK